jgi:hypothetical protein
MAQQPLEPGPPHYRGITITHFRHTTVGRTPPDEGPARRRDLYLTTHNTHTATGIGSLSIYLSISTYLPTYLLPTAHLYGATGQCDPLLSFHEFPHLTRNIFRRATSTDWLFTIPLRTQHNIITEITQISMPGKGSEPLIPVFEQQKIKHASDRGVIAVGSYQCAHQHLQFLLNWPRPYKLQDPIS